jgi:hypothetical protein
MASFSFFGVEEDRNKIINSIFALGQYVLLPDVHYEEPRPQILAGPNPVVLKSDQKARFFVSGPFSKGPPTMTQLKSGRSDGGYYIYEATGGPFLILSLPGCRVVKGITELGPGELYYRSEYWDEAITRPFKPSDELKQHYKIILKAIKPHLVHKKVGPQENLRWIGLAAWKLLEDGKAIILDNGKWFDVKGNFVKSNLNT